MILMLFWISRFSCSSARAPGANPQVYPVARVVRVMCVIIFSRVGAPSEIRSCCLFRSRAVRESQLSEHARHGNPSYTVHGRRGRRAPSPPARGTVRESAGSAWPTAQIFLEGVQIFPNRFRNFSKGSLGFFQNQFSGAEWARGVGHLEDSEIWNFSNVSLEFFQTHFGIFPKGVRNLSKEISEFVQREPGVFPRVFRKISFPGIWNSPRLAAVDDRGARRHPFLALGLQRRSAIAE